MTEVIHTIRLMTRGAYDMQALRIQMGNRLCANFRARLQNVPEPKEGEEEEDPKIIEELKKSYARITDGIAAGVKRRSSVRYKTLPPQEGFVGDGVISDYAELVLVDQYFQFDTQEKRAFAQLSDQLERLPIFTTYLKEVRGIGPAMAAVLVTGFDVHKAKYVSNFWSYAGLDVASDGFGRSMRKEHLIVREYTAKDGTQKTRNSVTFNPWLKSKMLGVMATSFLRVKDSPWAQTYYNYRHRLESDPQRVKATATEKKKRFAAGEDTRHLWTPGRIHRASLRYMVKMFLIEFYVKWRTLEGLEVSPTYQEAKLGHAHTQP